MNTTHTHRPIAAPPTSERPPRYSLRPWYRWILTAFAFPPTGYLAHLIVGRVDSVPAAVASGLIAGAGIGAAQWTLLRRRGMTPLWIPATAVGLGAGLAAGASLVSYRTDITSLALMGAVCGLAVGITQAAVLGNSRRVIGWIVANAALWALGWTVTTAAGVDVSQQWAVFGLFGCLTLATLKSIVIGIFVPAEPATP
jgi:hypothetical protein